MYIGCRNATYLSKQDISSGELTTNLTLHAEEDLSLDLEILQFACRSVPALVIQEVTVNGTADFPTELHTLIDNAGIPEEVYSGLDENVTRGWYKEEMNDQIIGFAGDRSKLGIDLLAQYDSNDGPREDVGRYCLDGHAGVDCRFMAIAAMVSRHYHPEPHLEAIRLSR